MGTLYEKIKGLCEQKGVSGGKMCVELGISKSLMTSLKKGRTKTITTANAQKIADYFNIPLEKLLTYDGAPLPCMKDDPPRDEKNPAPTNGDGKTYKEQLLDLIDDIAAHGTRDDLVDVLAAITAAMLKK